MIANGDRSRMHDICDEGFNRDIEYGIGVSVLIKKLREDAEINTITQNKSVQGYKGRLYLDTNYEK